MTVQYGLTDTGFRRKTYTEIITAIEAWQRAKISEKLDLSERTVLGNVNAIQSDELSQAWEAIEAAIGALDPDNAVEALLIGLCKLTGVTQGGATQGHAKNVTLTFSKATTIPAQTLLLAVSGEDTNLWSNDTAVTVASAGTALCDFTSVAAGAAASAPYSTLSAIKTPIDGLVSAVNTDDAIPGTDVQSLDALRVAREESLSVQGKGTTAAIAKALIEAGAADCRVFENDSSVPVDGLPAHSVQVITYAPALSDATIAQTIYDSKSATAETYGVLVDAAADPWGDTKYIRHTHASEVPIYVVIHVSGSASAAAIEAALMTAHTPQIDKDVLYAGLIAAAFQVPGVTNVTLLTLSTAPPPAAAGPTDITISSTSVGLLDTGRITVTIV
jgi:uncharacterized phage protein gp47/JayE